MNYNVNNIYPKPAINSAGTAVASQRLTVSNSAVQVATAFDRDTTMVVLDIQDADVMVTFDTQSPTTSFGHHLIQGTTYTWSKAAATAAKFIRQSSTDAHIHFSEFQV